MNSRQHPENYWYIRELQRGDGPIQAGPIFRRKLFASDFGDEALNLFELYANRIGNASYENIQVAREAVSKQIGFDPDEIYKFLPFRDKIQVIGEDVTLE